MESFRISWNYRVIKDGGNYRIVEVFYDDNGRIDGWADSTDTILNWYSYANLKGSAEVVLYAFVKLILVIEIAARKNNQCQ